MTTSRTTTELAAGGIMWRKSRKSLEILLVHRPRYRDWTFPKGRLNRGETLIHCAHREVEEETAYTATLGRRLPNSAYLKPSGRNKVVAYWAMRYESGTFEENREVDRIKWVRPDRALDRLTYEPDRRLLADLPPGWHKRETRLIVVRHGEAGRQGKRKGSDRHRPLSDHGRQQAQQLIEVLAPFRIRRIVTSPATRCVETVAPLAKAQSLPIRRSDDLREEASAKSTARFLANLRRGTTVISTHRPIVERIVDRLELAAKGHPVSRKGSCWIVDLDDRIVTGRFYIAPRR